MKKKILITGAAGFIGYHSSKFFLKKNMVLGIDNLNKYYDIKLKKKRLSNLKKIKNFEFVKIDLLNFKKLNEIVTKFKPEYIIHLAGQAGVRYSLNNPRAFINSNILGTFNILEICKNIKPKHTIIASSSSVYGNNKKIPFIETLNCNTPLSVYAATKLSCEHLSHTYAHIHKIPLTAVRFFSVYGPYGRPDMTPYKFLELHKEKKPIEIYNYGNMSRDFTYVEDVVQYLSLLLKKPSKKKIPFQLINISNSKKVKLIKFLKIIEKIANIKFKKKFKKKNILDVKDTLSNNLLLKKFIKKDYKIGTSITLGIKKFVKWYKNY
jgi:UDP-glucuronate 4-epimerase